MYNMAWVVFMDALVSGGCSGYMVSVCIIWIWFGSCGPVKVHVGTQTVAIGRRAPYAYLPPVSARPTSTTTRVIICITLITICIRGVPHNY